MTSPAARPVATLRAAAGLTVELRSDAGWRFGAREQLLAGAYLAADLDHRRGATGPGAVVIEHRLSPRSAFHAEQVGECLHVRVDAPWPEPGLELFHLVAAAARRTWMGAGLFVAHAAAAWRGNELVLIAGHTGTGKTTLLRDLLGHGWAPASGNLSVLAPHPDGLALVGGTATITTRAGDEHAWGVAPEDVTGYGDRRAFLLPAVASPTSPGPRPRAVTGVVLPMLSAGPATWAPLEPASALHQLYPLVWDAVAHDLVLFDGAHVWTGAEQPAAARALAGALAALGARVPVVTARGSAAAVAVGLPHALRGGA